ncbi:MAG: type I methionyl aminopeptidase [Nitrospirota bacterium]
MIMLKSEEEVTVMAAASRIVARTLIMLQSLVRPGVTTLELDEATEATIRGLGGVPAFKGYRNFPCSLCVSVNEQVVHGIPSRRRLNDGDIVGLDVGAVVDGYYGDAAVTVAVGAASPPVERLLRTTQQALYDGIAQAKVGNRLSDISHAIQRRAEGAGYSVVTEFVGHGIGRQLHEEPQIPNFGPPGQGPRLRPGMVLALEPMVNMGKSAVTILPDRWTVVTQDGSWSAHFEHTIAISEAGPRVLTAWEAEPVAREQASVG